MNLSQNPEFSPTLALQQLPRPGPYEVRAIYDGIGSLLAGQDLQGWNSDSPIFARLIAETRPSVIVEIGSWKGASACHMAATCKNLGLDTLIYCVDFWQDQCLHTATSQIPQRWDRGVSAYHQFLYNVWMEGHHDCIIPIRTWSPHGAPLLKSWGVKADLIYVDGGHTYEDCTADLRAYWPLLRKGGKMFGDDWCMESVQRAVRDFFHSGYTVEGPHWVAEAKR